MRVKVCVSSVAKLCGLNPYAPRAQALEELISTLEGNGQFARAKTALSAEQPEDVLRAARAMSLPVSSKVEALETERARKIARIEAVRASEETAVQTAVRSMATISPEKREEALRLAKQMISTETSKKLSEIVPTATTVERASIEVETMQKIAVAAIMPQVRLEVSSTLEKKAYMAESGDVGAAAALASLPIAMAVEQQRRMASGTLGEKVIGEEIQCAYRHENFEYAPPTKSTVLDFPDADISVQLVGRADAIVPGERVIEIKKRRNRLLGAPEYERIQLECYMRLYSLPNGSLFEEYAGKIVEHKFNRDDSLWCKIRGLLGDVAGDIRAAQPPK